MKSIANKNKRKLGIRKKVSGTAARPRLAVFRSNKHIYAQVIDDVEAKTLAAASDLKLKETGAKAAAKVGEIVATNAKKNKVTKVIFDRSGNKYHGVIKALADAAREQGLEF
jgi:large subunit ribosomal protein L18